MIALLAAVPALGQEADDAASKREEILAAIELPAAAQALRNKGVEKAEVKEALRAAKGKRIKAKNAKALLDESAKSVDENGKIDNFGAFVKSKLDEGLRGRDLAAAIRAEHQKRGKGKGKEKSAGKSKGKSTEKDAQKENEKGKEKEQDRNKERETEQEREKAEKGSSEKGSAGKGKGKQK
jgi:hypothetical protein